MFSKVESKRLIDSTAEISRINDGFSERHFLSNVPLLGCVPMNTLQGVVKEGDDFFTSCHSPVKHAVPGEFHQG